MFFTLMLPDGGEGCEVVAWALEWGFRTEDKRHLHGVHVWRSQLPVGAGDGEVSKNLVWDCLTTS